LDSRSSTNAALVQKTHPAENLELVMAILNHQDDNWVLILPDASEPPVHLFANSNDREWLMKV